MSANLPACDFDLFVIGGGSGGVRAARIAATHGARVGIAEEHRYGGTCVIRGCIPKKLLVYAARCADELHEARSFGWNVDVRGFDWPAIIAAKDREISRLESLYAANLRKAGVQLFNSRAVLRDAHTVELLANGRCVTAQRVLVATGGTPFVDADIPGHRHAITSNELFDLPRLPDPVVVVGGGYIACEFASLLNGLGARTTLVYRGDELLRGFDDELRTHLREAMQARGVDVRLQRQIARIDRRAQALEVELDDGSLLMADQVLMATGRRPNVEGLGLERLGVELGWNGHIVVDAFSRSSVPGLFAVGDVTDRVNLTPAAIREGHAFADTEFGSRPRAIEHTLVPTAVFTTPELGSVGLTQAQALERHPQVDVYRSVFRPLKAVLGDSTERMRIKLLVDPLSERVLGAHVLGTDAGEFVQLLAIALRMGATKADFDATLAVHPTIAEEFVTLSTRSERIVRR